jgi:hypothetical protein
MALRNKEKYNAYQRAWRSRKKMLLQQQQQELISRMTLEDGELKPILFLLILDMVRQHHWENQFL